MKRSTSKLRIVAVAGLVAAMVGATASVQQAAASPSRQPLRASTPRWLHHASDRGATPASSSVTFGLLLNMRDQTGAEQRLAQLSDPDSSSYGKYLTHAQFVAHYAPKASDVAAVRSWLHSQGLSVRSSLTGGMYLSVSGSAAQVERTFGTSLRNYRYKGQSVHTNTTALSVPASTPAAVTSAINGVTGLDEGTVLKKPASTTLPGPPPGSRYGVQPCSAYYGQKIANDKPAAYGKKQPYAVCGYTPPQYQGAYGESSLLSRGIDGTGVTVAITDAYAAPTILKDAQIYSGRHGVAPFTKGQFRQILPNKFNVYDRADAQGWYGEETLDVEAVHGMAPGAKVVYVGGRDDLGGLDEAWAKTIDTHVADIITNSWSYGSDNVDAVTAAFYDQYSIEAAMTGITVNFSSGDDGDETSSGTDPSAKDVGFPSDNPYLTSVGGTSVFIGKNNNWEGEYGWSNAYSTLVNGKWKPAPPGVYSSGGGGGTSTLYRQPFYQKGVVPSAFSQINGGRPMRVVPDIAMAGDPNTGFLVGETQRFPDGVYYDEYRIGGTSLSSPLLAGVDALVDQLAGAPIGFANPLYYKLVGTNALHDEVKPATPLAQVRTNYTNAVDASDGRTYILQTIDALSGTLKDTKGYDNETGVGSPDGPQFFLKMAALANGG